MDILTRIMHMRRMTVKNKYSKYYNAYNTVFWYGIGDNEAINSKNMLAQRFYYWFLDITKERD